MIGLIPCIPGTGTRRDPRRDPAAIAVAGERGAVSAAGGMR
jgi:hypothetical protein